MSINTLKELGFAIGTTAAIASISVLCMVSLMDTSTASEKNEGWKPAQFLGCKAEVVNDYIGYIVPISIQVCRIKSNDKLRAAQISRFVRRARPGIRPKIDWLIRGESADVIGLYQNGLQRFRFIRVSGAGGDS